MAWEIMPLHSAPVSQVNNVSTTGELLERTIRSTVEQHLFDVQTSGSQSSEDSECGGSPASSTVAARQKRWQKKNQNDIRQNRERAFINKENIPSEFSSLEDCILTTQEAEKFQENNCVYIEENSKPKRQKSSTRLSEINDNQDSHVNMENINSSRTQERFGCDDILELMSDKSKENSSDGKYPPHSQLILQMRKPRKTGLNDLPRITQTVKCLRLVLNL
uniref:Family with sequence similarity 13 member A n=1 Tax=Monodelphis domestica TaxID=13616 RepID=A0A5F8GTD0_MONDO